MTHTEDALVIAAGIVGLVIGFIICRYGSRFLFEWCVTEEQEQEQSNSICPCYRRQNQSSNESSSSNGEAPITMQDVEAVPKRIREDRLIHALPVFHLSADTVKECKLQEHNSHDNDMLDRDEETPRKEDNNCSPKSNSAIVCSICIHELIPGDTVFKTPHCNHFFHRNCIYEWMTAVKGCNDIECPNCRSVIISRAALNRVFLGGPFEPETV